MPRQPWSPEQAPALHGRLAVVTGATGGLGLQTALGLARRGARVVVTGRNPEKGRAALALVEREAIQGGARFEPLDLASLDSVAAFADRMDGEATLDILVNNAGVMALPRRQVTQDGFERQFGTNYLGHFALTARLLPLLLRAGSGSRVVSVSSMAHRRGTIGFDDLQGARRYRPWRAYAQSKLAMLIFAREFQRRCRAQGWPLASLAAHPGWAMTDIILNGPGEGHAGPREWAMQAMFRLAGQSAAAGALPILFAAMAPEAEAGGYYGPSGWGEIRGSVAPSKVMPQAADETTARRLWSESERLTGLSLA